MAVVDKDMNININIGYKFGYFFDVVKFFSRMGPHPISTSSPVS